MGWELAKTASKLAAVVIVLVTAWNDVRPRIMRAVPDMFVLMHNVGGVSRVMFARVAMLAAVIGMIDVVIADRRYRKSVRMTKQEVREEVRQTEGDPHIRGDSPAYDADGAAADDVRDPEGRRRHHQPDALCSRAAIHRYRRHPHRCR